MPPTLCWAALNRTIRNPRTLPRFPSFRSPRSLLDVKPATAACASQPVALRAPFSSISQRKRRGLLPQFRVLAASEIPVHDTSAHSPPRASTPLVAVGALASLTADSLRLTHTHTRVPNSAFAASTTRTLPSSPAVPTPPLFSPAPRIARGVSPASSHLKFGT